MTAQISNLLRETKVNQFDMAIFVEENVLRFEITMADTTLVQVFDSTDEFEVEFRCLLLV